MTDNDAELARWGEAFELPRRKRGRQAEGSEAAYQEDRAAFCRLILQLRSRMDFKVGARGWCYVLEEHGLAKGDFDRAESLVTDCRKAGDLPLDICAEDDARVTIGLQDLNDPDVEREADSWISHLRDHAHRNYAPFSFWGDQGVYLERPRWRSSTCAICSSGSAPSSSSRSPTSKAGPISMPGPP